ncbi:hypothetical protein [uncultured Halomonas sp.]|uniref:hypothetical protein n=1 Tax=uncultured Halomonas sp. TaxID=173971 RepID=UPI002605AD2A|nr:hypothetical protein [uncultured Halomonas sp.]
MPDQIRVNIKHRINNAAIKRETRNGRDVIVVPSAVAKFDTVLNGILYPREELESSYKGLERTPAPLGHPMIGNAYAPARDPEAINTHHIGAWNERVRIEGDRIMADMVIDVEYAKRHPEGDRLLNALESGEPISTSTGLYMEREPAPEGAEYRYIGRNYSWDHLAVLLDETPAIGTEAGIGLMVNGEQVEVVESELNIDDDMLTMMAWELVNEKEYKDKRKRNESLVEKVKNAIRGAFRSTMLEEEAAGLNVNSDEDQSMTPEELKAALDQQAETLTAAFNAKLDETIKPLNDRIEAMDAEREAAAEAEHTAAVEAVVNAKLMDEEEAKAVPTKALNAMLKATKRAAPLAPGMAANSSDTLSQYQLPEGD